MCFGCRVLVFGIRSDSRAGIVVRSNFDCHRVVGIGRMIIVGFCVILVSILWIFLCISMGLFILVDK